MENKNYVITALAILFVVAAIFAVNGQVNRISVDDAKQLIDNAVMDKVVELNNGFDVEKLSYEDTIKTLNDANAVLNADTIALEADKVNLQAELDIVVTAETTTTAEDDGTYFLVEDVPLDGNFATTIDNDELSFLAYADVEYNDDTIDFEEKLYFTDDFAPMLNVDDFGSEAAVGIEDDYALWYRIEFDDPIVFVADEELEIEFLGQPYTLVDYDAGELTFRVSEQYEGTFGDAWVVDGITVKVLEIDGDNEKVRIQVGDETEIVTQGDERNIGDLSIYVDEVFVATIPEDMAWVSLYIGEDIVQEVNNGEEFFDSDVWEWVIEDDGTDLTAIGVKYADDISDDEDVWHVGDGLSYPFDYASVTFSEVKNAEVNDVTLSLTDTKLKVSYDGKIEVDGDRIDDAKFTVDITVDPREYEYYYKGDKFDGNTDFSRIVFFSEDREFGFGMSTTVVRVGLNDPSGYRFEYIPDEFTASLDGAVEMNDDEDYLTTIGDVLYKSEVNDADDKEDLVKVGFVSDEDVEVILRVE